MRTTLHISDALLEELRVRAHETGRSINAIVEEVLRRGLSAAAQPRKNNQPKAFKVGINTVCLGMSMNQLYDQLEAESTLEVSDKK